MKNFRYIALFLIVVIFSYIFSKNIYSLNNEGKLKFRNFIDTLNSKIPNKFNCELESKLFDDIINQLPQEAFLDKKNKPPKIVLYYEKGKAPLYMIENIYDDYKSFIKNYFTFLNDSMAFFVFSENKINQFLTEYDIKYSFEKSTNVYKVSKNDENRVLVFYTDRKNILLNKIEIYFNGQKYINLSFKFKYLKSYILPYTININLIDENQEIKISFVNYKIYK